MAKNAVFCILKRRKPGTENSCIKYSSNRIGIKEKESKKFLKENKYLFSFKN
jgi:hypothetical protein